MEPCPRSGAFSACLFLSRTTQIWSTEVKSRHYGFGLRRVSKPVRQCSWVHSFPWKENYFPYRSIFYLEGWVSSSVAPWRRKGNVCWWCSAEDPLSRCSSSEGWWVGGWTAHSPPLRSEYQCIPTENLILPYAGQGSTAIVVPPSPAPSGHTHTFFFFFSFWKVCENSQKENILNQIYIYIFKITKLQIQNKNNSLVLLRGFVAQALHVLLTHWRLTITLWGTDPIFQLRRLQPREVK